MGERRVRWTPYMVFSFVMLAWVAGIVLPFLPQILNDVQPQDNPYIGISSAVIGAGPFVLYVIYQEYVKSPRFVITKEKGEQGITGVYFDKIIVKQGNSIFPVIEAVTTVKNVGGESVDDASARVNLETKDPTIKDVSFDSRWTGDLYASTTDLHPGRERELLLFQIVPTQDCINELDISLDDELIVSKEEIFSLNFDADPSPDPISGFSGDLYLQRPLNPNSEAFEYENKDVSDEAKRRFIGRTIPCSDSFDIAVQIGSSNWSGSIEVATIAMDDTLLQGRWYSSQKKYEPLRERLTEIGWTKE